MRALSIRQPHAEAIMRGIKKIEYRSAPTRIRGRIYIYAAKGRYSAAKEAKMMKELQDQGRVRRQAAPRRAGRHGRAV
jgi:hypothetical protein